jgi:hydrogenase nickel incorporation protein HypA/HybF
MHELSVASSIAQSVMDFARKYNACEVLEVKLSIGEMSCLGADQLKFCYGAVCKETLLEGSTLEIEKTKAVVSCQHCQYKGAPKMWDEAYRFVQVPTLQCPECGRSAEVVEGKECTIKNIKYVE